MTAATTTVVAVEGEAADAVAALALDGVRRHNRAHAAPPGFAPLTLAARDGDAVVGGLVAETGWEWLHVQLLWVEEAHRGRGIGRRLLAEAEAEARRRGCRHAYLDTFEFQAPRLYARLGWTVFGEQDDYPPGHRRFFLRKPLDAAPAAS